ncbi:MAG: hypothetical protein ACRC0V_06155 [Fusobacteriaceae bacterium]
MSYSIDSEIKEGNYFKILEMRNRLEKKYSRCCIKYGYALPKKGNRVMSVSPTSYYHHTKTWDDDGGYYGDGGYCGGVNANGYDINLYKQINNFLHSGKTKRAMIEQEGFQLMEFLNIYISSDKFFLVKDTFLESYPTFEIYNRFHPEKRIKKKDYNRLKNIFNLFSEESKKEHYHVNGCLKRLNKKI